MDINKKVLLLAIAKKQPDESLEEVLAMLENAHVFRRKEGKRLLRELKSEALVNESGLTPKGALVAKEVEEEFRL